MKKETAFAVIAALLVLGVVFAIPFILPIWSAWALKDVQDLATGNLGTFGDMFGVANSLFSGLAFAGLIYTILLQRRELQLQREELAMTREELRRSAVAQEASEEALKAAARISAFAALASINLKELELECAKPLHSLDQKKIDALRNGIGLMADKLRENAIVTGAEPVGGASGGRKG